MAGIASRFDIKDGLPPSDTDPILIQNPIPILIQNPYPIPILIPIPALSPIRLRDIASLLPSIRDIGTITTGQNNPVIIDGRQETDTKSGYLPSGSRVSSYRRTVI